MVTNKNGDGLSLALSVLKDMPEGNFERGGAAFYVRNNTESTVSVEVVPYGNKDNESVRVNIPGLSELPVLVKKVINAPAGLQWGY